MKAKSRLRKPEFVKTKNRSGAPSDDFYNHATSSPVFGNDANNNGNTSLTVVRQRHQTAHSPSHPTGLKSVPTYLTFHPQNGDQGQIYGILPGSQITPINDLALKKVIQDTFPRSVALYWIIMEGGSPTTPN